LTEFLDLKDYYVL